MCVGVRMRASRLEGVQLKTGKAESASCESRILGAISERRSGDKKSDGLCQFAE